MARVTKEMVVNDVIKQYPHTIPVFNRFRVDACCGGGRSLGKMAQEDGVEIEELLSALNRVLEGKR